ncbi:hypothetical protein H9L10_01855 [Phycicoccus endophyticus]|uniref:Uncharacterized protein n=1 Tax=Phycicoccus endophyticus TaxID=1690220 RepID=A0A7G9R2N5_9MICO|nr:tetraspanin family protein [Phycicoccus endophyticus]NHI20675.1 tetraspanin family protein [Phycicoccus endophyticus]QNN49860.1 hypothetical protein H9L10_01855 [Phycicoccus endophyticus]GGL35816.1 hypothetical protein GCM10012283_17780 [Phycicoccus endophyticus]
MGTDDTTRPLGSDPDATDAPTEVTAEAPTADEPVPEATGPVTTAAAPAPAAAEQPPPLYRSGPAPFAVVLGLLGLVTAAWVLLAETTDLTVPWADLGPWTIVAAGVLIVLVGLLGIRGSRRPE